MRVLETSPRGVADGPVVCQNAARKIESASRDRADRRCFSKVQECETLQAQENTGI